MLGIGQIFIVALGTKINQRQINLNHANYIMNLGMQKCINILEDGNKIITISRGTG